MLGDIIVIGGGMIGLSTAFNLAQQGQKIILLEKDFPGKHASGVNAGGVRSLKRDVNELPLIHGALDMWHHMPKIVGSDCGFYETGYLVAAETQSDMADLENRVAITQAMGYDNEIVIDRATLRKLVPPIADHCVGGIMSERDGHASPAETCRAFLAACLEAGVQVYSGCEVLGIDTTATGFKVTTSYRGIIESEQVLNCGGAWAGNLARMLDDPLPITPVGPSVMVTAPVPRLFRHFVTSQGRKLWFNQARNGTILICGGYLADIDLPTATTHLRFARLQECIRTARKVLTGTGTLQIVRAWAGLDGNTPDDLPIIGYSAKIPGLMHACGFSKHGFAISPMVGRVVSALMQGRSPEINISGLELSRF
jgi:sarcosine oxidase subunit beta